MRKRATGSDRARINEDEPREIEPSSAAHEPMGRSPEPVFDDDSTAAGKSGTRPATDKAQQTRQRKQGKNVRRPSEDKPRQVVNDAQWRRAKGFLTVKGRGRKAKNLRRTLEGILYVFRTGAPWRDLPRHFGKWSTVYKMFRRLCNRGAFLMMFMSLAKELDLRVVMVDGSFVKVHQHAVGARRGERTLEESRIEQAIGKTRGGLNSLLLALADQNGKLVALSLLPGNSFEARHLTKLLEGLPISQIQELLADKAYDTNAVREMLTDLGIDATIPSKSNRKEQIPPRPVFLQRQAPG